MKDNTLIKAAAIDRFGRENKHLLKRRYGLPNIGKRLDGEDFNPAVDAIARAINYYGYEVRDENIVEIPDTDLGSGNPLCFKPFPLAVQAMIKYLQEKLMYSYPYTEGDDNDRKKLLEYVEKRRFYKHYSLFLR